MTTEETKPQEEAGKPSLLSGIKIGRESRPRRLLLYGTQGIGKSTFAAQAPNAIFLQTEDGLGEIDCNKFPLCSDYSNALALLETLYHESHEYNTLVIDSLDWLERLIHIEYCRINSLTHMDDVEFAKTYKLCLTQWREVLNRLDALYTVKNMMIIFVSHSQIEKYKHPEVDSYDRYAPRIHKWASAIIQEWCDEVFFACYKVTTSTSDEGFGAKRTKGVAVGGGSGERVMRTCERPAHSAKNRLSMPDELPFLWKHYAEYIGVK